jgi:hypothetical protein
MSRQDVEISILFDGILAALVVGHLTTMREFTLYTIPVASLRSSVRAGAGIFRKRNAEIEGIMILFVVCNI